MLWHKIWHRKHDKKMLMYRDYDIKNSHHKSKQNKFWQKNKQWISTKIDKKIYQKMFMSKNHEIKILIRNQNKKNSTKKINNKLNAGGSGYAAYRRLVFYHNFVLTFGTIWFHEHTVDWQLLQQLQTLFCWY